MLFGKCHWAVPLFFTPPLRVDREDWVIACLYVSSWDWLTVVYWSWRLGSRLFMCFIMRLTIACLYVFDRKTDSIVYELNDETGYRLFMCVWSRYFIYRIINILACFIHIFFLSLLDFVVIVITVAFVCSLVSLDCTFLDSLSLRRCESLRFVNSAIRTNTYISILRTFFFIEIPHLFIHRYVPDRITLSSVRWQKHCYEIGS